ncbi:MAG: SGNH/GDSL hydrolase family protein [Acidobacteria bacterium]|nr:SGNH/GDSL hydrolase family protein [Acidobacteriota bacterium]
MARALKRAAAVVLATMVALSIAEIALRILAPEWLRARAGAVEGPASREKFTGDQAWPIEEVNDAFVAFQPGATLEMRNPEYRVLGHSDRWGGRSTGIDATSSSPLIPFVGDSQTFGVGVADDQTFVSLLARRLGRPFLNLGVPGSSLRDHLHIIVNRHEALGRPRVYLFVFYAGNDLSDLVNDRALDAPRTNANQPPWFLAVPNDVIFHRTPLGRSHVLQLAKLGLLGAFGHVPTLPQDQMFESADLHRVEFRAQATRELDRQLDFLGELAVRLDFRPVFLVVPDRYQVSPALLERTRRAYWLGPDEVDVRFPNRLLRDTLAPRSVPVVDPLDCMMNRDGLHYRESHMTAAGHRALAECVAAELDTALSAKPR